MAKKKRTLVIRDAAVLRALRTPLRQEILSALDRPGGASVRELATTLGRKPASLYYHVHDLVRVGLVEGGRYAAGGSADGDDLRTRGREDHH